MPNPAAQSNTFTRVHQSDCVKRTLSPCRRIQEFVTAAQAATHACRNILIEHDNIRLRRSASPQSTAKISDAWVAACAAMTKSR
jgi:hypothetical protein